MLTFHNNHNRRIRQSNNPSFKDPCTIILTILSANMSISEENASYADAASFNGDDDNETVPSQYDNARGDRYSEETSSYHASVHIDPSAKNKKLVKRLNPETEKMSRVEFFSTYTVPNAIIRNAISGTYQSANGRFFRVGTADEDLFFSVILATGESGQEAPVLFYDNPEQYERHFFTKLSNDVKDSWFDKRDSALFRLKLQQQRANTAGVVVVK